MPTNLLVSASTNIKVWDLMSKDKNANEDDPSKSIPERLLGVEVASFTPNNTLTAINVVRWSHDNQLLAVAGNDGTLTIHNSQGTLMETILSSDNESSDYADINALRFLNKSQYVLFGGSDKIINVWDRKESIFIEPFKGHRSTITCIDLNLDESIVASSASNGNIIIHNRQKSNTWNNLIVSTKQPINVLQYSYVKRGLLAAGEIKGIAFSPSNQHFLASAGMDKRIVLYDDRKKESLKNIHADSPLTALAFRADCVTIAAGTQQGKILVYDLRSHNKVMCTLHGHEPRPIQCLQFQEKERVSVRRPTLNRNKSSHVRKSSKESILPVSSNKSTNASPTPSPPATSEQKEKNYMDMFSPIKDTIEDSVINDVKTTTKTTNKNVTKTPSPVKSDIISSGIIDNLKARLVNKVGEAIEKIPIIGNSDSILPDTTSPKKRVAFMDFESIPNKNDITTAFASNGNINHINHNGTTKTNENIVSTTVTTSSSSTNHKNNNGAAITNENIDTFTSNNDSDTSNINHNGTTTVNKNLETSTSNSNNSTIGTATSFQLQVIGSVVDECLQDFRISLRNDIQNMHLELLRQFHIQKTEMEMMFLKYCGETMSLREEVERLREENQSKGIKGAENHG
ncbi:protein NEDD1 isoform X1 [Rhizophagus clarus]|uniref:Protein NEDD1 isoform X1 n=1 Tax=Rhizophagus clarus TaxID=94130 RepID=A0A8H3R0Y4_9GLOM|nr:protein NEDD1 isoform X1 [Rhizophagus clarus]